MTRDIPSGVLKSAVGMPCSATLCQGSSFWAVLNGTTCCQMSCFSNRKSAVKALVVVTTRFCPRVLETVAMTGSLIPLSENALLRAFLVARGEKSELVLVTDLIRISRFWEAGLAGLGAWALFFFSTKVHSSGLADLAVPCVAMLVKEGLVSLVEVIELVLRGGSFVEAWTLASALALFSICLVAVARLATWEAMIEEAACSLPFSVYSLKISKRSNSFDCSSRDLVKV